MKSFSKSNFVKIFGSATLATLIATAGIFAFAPLGASAQVGSNSQNPSLNSNLNNSTSQTTEQTGLITPHADDPVLFTTESGLEIKYNNAISLGGGKETSDGLASGNLVGFPYFETSDGSKSYIWVIIGKSTTFNSNLFINAYHKLEEAKEFPDAPAFGTYFSSCYEDTSVAGSVLQSDNLSQDVIARAVNFESAVWDKVKSNAEIVNSTGNSTNCVLVLANEAITSATWGSYYWYNNKSDYYYYASYFGQSSIKTTMNNYYTNPSLGLQSIKPAIQTITINTYEHSISGTSISFTTRSNDVSIFPLAYDTSSSFCWSTYLTANQVKLTSNQWLRGTKSTERYFNAGTGWYYGYVCNSSGTNSTLHIGSSASYRPAFVMSLV